MKKEKYRQDFRITGVIKPKLKGVATGVEDMVRHMVQSNLYQVAKVSGKHAVATPFYLSYAGSM